MVYCCLGAYFNRFWCVWCLEDTNWDELIGCEVLVLDYVKEEF